MHSILTENLDQIKELCTKFKVQSLYAFGSVCTDSFHESSDIDLLISLKPRNFGDYADTYFALVDGFEAIFNRSVDLVTDQSLGNPYFIQSITRTKTPLYEA